jgi:low affinity Fe/Cu permease
VEDASLPGSVAQRREQIDGHVRQQSGASAPLDPARHRSWSSRALHRLGDWASQAAAGVVVACVVAAWVAVGALTGFPRWWETILYSTAASVTVVMVFAIQHTQRREQLVTQRKLDELLRALPEADDQLIAAEGASDDELDALEGLNVADRRLAASPDDRRIGHPSTT